MGIRMSLGILAGKSAILLGKILGKKSSSAPGSVALKIYPGILKELSSKIKSKTICVCGTNGKTTTTNLIYSFLTSQGKKVVCNNVGANMLPGVACAYIKDACLSGKHDADYAVLECDEASLRHIAKHINIDKIIVTNLFRDQLDRYGDVEATMRLLEEAFNIADKAELYLNSDDPISADFGRRYKARYYGIDYHQDNKKEDIKEGKYCLNCGAELEYEKHYYSQMGIYKCPACSLKRPEPDYLAKNVSLNNGIKFDIEYQLGKKQSIDVDYKGFYNIYNILGAFSIYESLGLNTDTVNSILSDYKPQIGRMETFVINNKKITLNLAKNPAGFNQAIETLMDDNHDKDVFVAVNDMPSDGVDVSWIWDVDFEKLTESKAHTIYAGGTRKDELALCLDYNGCKIQKVCDVNAETLRELINSSERNLYILVNYTVLFDTQTILKKMESEGK